MDVVSSEARSCLPSELLYANDLVIMTSTMELGRRVADCRASLLGKGLKVIAGKCDGWKQWWEGDCKLWKVVLWCLWERSTDKLSAQYVKK